MERLLTAHELAEVLNLSVETVWRYTRRQEIPVIELGEKQYRYRKEGVTAALAGGGLIREGRSLYPNQGEYTYEDYLRIDGPCDLVVEVMSPTNRRKDRVRKMEIYRQAGIPHYWLVDPEDSILEALMLKDGDYLLVFVGGPGDQFTHPAFPGLSLDLDKVFYRPEAD